MASIVVLLCVSWFGLAAAGTAPPYNLEDAEHHFESFIQTHGKVYPTEEEKQHRFKVFKDNLLKVNKMNAESDHAVFGITGFSDLTEEEFQSRYGCFKNVENHRSAQCDGITDADINYNDAPESFDWRDHNVVTRVKSQESCGSCYAFSAIGNVESLYAMKYNKTIELSEQQIVDCDNTTWGCDGGFMTLVFEHLIDVGGSETEADYPYVGHDENECAFDQSKVKVKLSNCYYFDLQSQEKLKQILYHNGPISVAIQAAALPYYVSGILGDDWCTGSINHGVLLVGYGSENGRDYWIIKNSWDENFGENGYFRMQRGEDAHSCDMLNDWMSSAVIA